MTAHRRTWPTGRTAIVVAAVIIAMNLAWLVFGVPLVIAIAFALIVFAAWIIGEIVYDHRQPKHHRLNTQLQEFMDYARIEGAANRFNDTNRSRTQQVIRDRLEEIRSSPRYGHYKHRKDQVTDDAHT